MFFQLNRSSDDAKNMRLGGGAITAEKVFSRRSSESNSLVPCAAFGTGKLFFLFFFLLVWYGYSNSKRGTMTRSSRSYSSFILFFTGSRKSYIIVLHVASSFKFSLFYSRAYYPRGDRFFCDVVFRNRDNHLLSIIKGKPPTIYTYYMTYTLLIMAK